MTKFDKKGKIIGTKKAPIDQNLAQTVALIKDGGIEIEEALKLITLNPAINLGLYDKGRIEVGCDADLCCFTHELELEDVFAKGQQMMENGNILAKGNFEN